MGQAFATILATLFTCLPGASAGPSPLAADNPFNTPVLDVRPRIFLRNDRFDGLTVAKLRKAAQSPEFRGVRAKWASRPMGKGLLWLLDGNDEDLAAAVAGLRGMNASSGTWSDRGLKLVDLATLFDWLYPELDESTRAMVARRIEQAADAGLDHIRRGRAPFYYSRTPGALAGVTLAGLALKGVSPRADEYLKVFRTWGVGEHGGVDPFRLAVQMRETLEVLVLRIVRRVRLMDPEIEVERFLGGHALPDEPDGVPHVVVDRHLAPGAVVRAVRVESVLRRKRSVRDHGVRQVPLPEVPGGVAGLLEQPRQEDDLRVQPVGHAAFDVALHGREVPVNSVPRRKLPRQDRGPAGRADPAGDRELMESRPAGR